MRTMIATRLSALAFAAALGLSAAASAQPPPPPPPPGGMAAHGWGHPGMEAPHAMHGAGRLKAVHDALNIRPDQEAAFAAFAASMKPPEAGERREPGDMMHDHQALTAMTTPQRLDFMARKMDEHMGRMREEFQRHAAAIKALYAVLSPDQQHTFDALPGLMGHGGMGGMGGGMGPHGGMGMEPGMGMGHPGEGE